MQDTPQNKKASPDIFKRAVRGGWWVLGSRLVQQTMAMARLIVLARILTPDDFGLLALALLTISILNQFSVTGFNVALVQKKSNIEDYLSSAWTFGLIRGAVLYGILFVLAPFVAIFFDSPDVTMIIRVIGISAILTSFNNIGTIFFQKELDFKKQFIFTNLGTLTDVTVAIVLAVIYESVWSLVAGQISGMFVRCILSYILHSYRPRLQLDWEKIADMWNYGKHIMVTSILKFFCLEGDDIFLGKMLGTHTLGLYRYAYKISNMVATEIRDVIGGVSFPAFAKLQNDLEKLKAGYVKTLQVITLVTYPIAGGIVILAHELIIVILGVKWFDMASAMQILCVLGAAKCMQGGTVFNSLNRPDISAKISTIRLSLIIITIYPLTKKFDMSGTALSVTVSSLLIVPISLYYVNKLIGHRMRDYVGLISLPLISTLIMMLTVYQVRLCFDDIGLLSLFILIGVGGFSYCIYVLLLSRFYKEYDLAEIAGNLMKGLK